MEIRTSLDWAGVDTEIRKLIKVLPMYEKDIRKMSSNIERLVKELGQLEVVARNNKSPWSKQKCQQKVKEINEDLRKLRAFHTFSLLATPWD